MIEQHRIPKARVLLLLLLGFVFLLVMSDCGEQQGNTEQSKSDKKYLGLHDSVNYIGMQACRQCHEPIYQSFMKTGMGQSFDHATQQKSAADFDNLEAIYDEYKDFWYQPFWKGDTLKVKEFRLEGQDTVYSKDVAVSYIVGSGHHTNSHIVEENGYLHQAPFTYYTQDSVLDLPPGFEDGNNSRFTRKIGLECMSCHNAYPKWQEGSINKYSHVPQGIDCERCHGPGEAHQKAMLAGNMVDVSKEVDYSIVNPAKLDHDRQIDLCQRCHLQGNSVLKPNKTFLDFKPGMRLQEVYDVFMPVFEDPEGQFIMASHPHRLRMSECFKQSGVSGNQTMTCISCHNPHQSVRETKRAYFNDKCQSCHGNEGESCSALESDLVKASYDCVTCHMPPTGTQDIPHVSITDHFIRVPQESSLPSSIQDNRVVGLACLSSDSPEPATIALAYLNYYQKFLQDKAFLDSAAFYLNQLSLADFPSLHVRMAFLRGKWKDLVSKDKEQFWAAISEPEPLYMLGQAYVSQGDASKALAYYDQAISLQPFNLDYKVAKASLLSNLGQTEDAIRLFDAVLEEYPRHFAALNNKGFALLAVKQWKLASDCFAKVLEYNPDHENALLNLAQISLLEGRIEEAKAFADRALRAHPNSEAVGRLMQVLKAS